jgi:predicted RNase H-like HicB family nuclease
MKFKIMLEKDENGWFVATVPSLPGCISQGKTEKEAFKNIQEAIKLHITSLAEDGLPLNGKKNTKESFVAVSV